MNDVLSGPIEPTLLADPTATGTTTKSATTKGAPTKGATTAGYDHMAPPLAGCKYEVCQIEAEGGPRCDPGFCMRDEKNKPAPKHPRPPCPLHDVKAATSAKK